MRFPLRILPGKLAVEMNNFSESDNGGVSPEGRLCEGKIERKRLHVLLCVQHHVLQLLVSGFCCIDMLIKGK